MTGWTNSVLTVCRCFKVSQLLKGREHKAATGVASPLVTAFSTVFFFNSVSIWLWLDVLYELRVNSWFCCAPIWSSRLHRQHCPYQNLQFFSCFSPLHVSEVGYTTINIWSHHITSLAAPQDKIAPCVIQLLVAMYYFVGRIIWHS